MFTLDDLDHVALSVRDLARSIQWYTTVLGMERRYQEAWGDVPAMMLLHQTGLALFPAQRAVPSDEPQPVIAVRHVAFRASRANFEQAQRELQAQGITFEFQDHVISHSIYFQDPDGHQLEITTYEV